jgi:hypothetical protein
LSPFTRRTLLKSAGMSALVVATGRMTGTAGATDGQTPRLQWEPVGTAPIATIASSNPHEAELLHPTLLPLRSLTGRSTDPAWMLWAWHHDTNNVDPHLHAWTASNVEGAFSALPEIPRPAGDYVDDPAGHAYTFGHFSSGDFGWDPDGQRLISTPHSVSKYRPSGLAETPQDSFMMESTDGVNWQWLDNDASARLRCGGIQDLDSNHTGYGRLLRDLDGRLQKVGGQYWWIYRGGHHSSAGAENEISFCTPLLASATAIGGPWIKRGKAFDTPYENTTLLGFDAFVLANDTPGVFYSVASPGYAPIVSLYAQAAGPGAMTFTDPGVPIVLPSVPRQTLPAVPGQAFGGGGNVVRHPQTHQQYLVQTITNAKYVTDTSTTPPTATPVVVSSDVWLYKAVVSTVPQP